MQYGLCNKPKSIKIVAKASSKRIFRWLFCIFILFHFTTFLKIKKRGKTYKKR